MNEGARTRLLVILLRLAGFVTVTAFLAMLLPVDWMASTHRSLGLGEFPAAPITEYLARSVAAFYGFHGVLLFVVSRDPRRYTTIIAYIAIMNAVFGAMLIAIDLHAGLPMWWTMGEGPPIVAFGIVIGLLNRG